jgi:hypothetical protein
MGNLIVSEKIRRHYQRSQGITPIEPAFLKFHSGLRAVGSHKWRVPLWEGNGIFFKEVLNLLDIKSLLDANFRAVLSGLSFYRLD